MVLEKERYGFKSIFNLKCTSRDILVLSIADVKDNNINDHRRSDSLFMIINIFMLNGKDDC